MKIPTFALLAIACLTLNNPAHAQASKMEQKTAFCATTVEIPRKHDSNDSYLCETKEYTCGSYLKPSCLADAKNGGWEVLTSSRKTVLKDFANVPCNCVGTEYVLNRKALTSASVPDATPTATDATAPVTPVVSAPGYQAPVSVAKEPAGSLANEVEMLKKDNLRIKGQLEQLQRQIDELKGRLPLVK